MQTKIKYTVLFWMFTLLCIFRISVFAQDQGEVQYGVVKDGKDCSACAVTPDSLTKYISFMRSLLNTLQSNRSIDIAKLEGADQAARANALTNENKNTLEEYMGIFAREGRYIGGKIQGATREGALGIARDFVMNFGREAVAGVKSNALVRDLEKLENLDESIDRKAITHIDHFVRKKAIPADQIKQLNMVLGSYEQLFTTGTINETSTYRDVVVRMRSTNDKMKNYVSFTPNSNFGLSTYKGISYNLNEERVNAMKSDYSCVKQVLGLNCNQTYGKTSGLWKEFTRTAGNELEQTYKKFEHSIKRLKDFKNGGIEQGGLFINGNRIDKEDVNAVGNGIVDVGQAVGGVAKKVGNGVANSVENMKDRIQDKKQQKKQLKEIHDECKAKVEKGTHERDDSLLNQRSDIEKALFMTQYNKLGCHEKIEKQNIPIANVTKSEESQILQLKGSMDDNIDDVLAINEEESNLNKLASPITTTSYFPLLSKKVYATRKTVEELTKFSIESCLSFCSNLNAKVNCGSN